jgi:hypothetical protein
VYATPVPGLPLLPVGGEFQIALISDRFFCFDNKNMNGSVVVAAKVIIL